ncbi:MAG: hypothetical protein OEW90_13415 [Betaproteobacteria bacterium]|nr:hypothetical protein [Betaproteobacteria bacterium]MDH4325129.1 hypothetical protein [Betaproteobacteria bacterium]
MKRLVGLPLEEGQEDDILQMLDEARITYRVTRSFSIFAGGGAIWVPDEDYPRARELLEREAQAFAASARAKWRAEWRTEHQGSYPLWLWNRFRRTSPSTLLKAIVLIGLLGLMLFYPLALVL